MAAMPILLTFEFLRALIRRSAVNGARKRPIQLTKIPVPLKSRLYTVAEIFSRLHEAGSASATTVTAIMEAMCREVQDGYILQIRSDFDRSVISLHTTLEVEQWFRKLGYLKGK